MCCRATALESNPSHAETESTLFDNETEDNSHSAVVQKHQTNQTRSETSPRGETSDSNHPTSVPCTACNEETTCTVPYPTPRHSYYSNQIQSHCDWSTTTRRVCCTETSSGGCTEAIPGYKTNESRTQRLH
uniref:Uncharacterized protein n=1 Tax=Cacopsylla melanoneura TaxID=428564 RepID=A0A8D8QVT6_9HEMI